MGRKIVFVGGVQISSYQYILLELRMVYEICICDIFTIFFDTFITYVILLIGLIVDLSALIAATW